MRRQLYILMLMIIGTMVLSVNFISPHQILIGSSTVSAAAQNPALVNVALGKAASQSSTDTINGIFADASRAIDGNTSGDMSAGSVSQTLPESQHWWQLDLGAETYIDNIRLYNRTGCCEGDSTFSYIFVSKVPFTSTDQNVTRNQPGIMRFLTHYGSPGGDIIELNQTAQYIRIQLVGASQIPLHLAEVKVMGLPIATSPAMAGQWTQIHPDLPGIPVHMSLLPNGKLLFWGRDKGTNTNPGFIDDAEGGCNTYLWDPAATDNPFTSQDERVTPIRNDRTNLFCSAHSFLPNGNLFVAGGSEVPMEGAQKRHDRDGQGTIQTNIFDYINQRWVAGPNMNQRRWYPSVVTLSNGETLIVTGNYVSGFDEAHNPIRLLNRDTEILQQNQTFRRTVNGVPTEVPNYPYAHLSPEGNVLVVSGTDQNGLAYYPSTNIWDDMPNLTLNLAHDQGTSVMYDKGKIMVIGGLQSLTDSSRDTETININPPNSFSSSWTPANPMNFKRYFATSVLMPDGQMFVVGGSRCGGGNHIQNSPEFTCDDGAIMHPEIYNPTTGDWSIMARQTVIRMYHSVALLMPDARILVAGGGRPGAYGENGNLFLDKLLEHREAEFFSPPYLFKSNGTPAIRPTITNDIQSIDYGQSFSVGIGTVPASQITKVVLVRLPSVTHTLNFDQQRVVLPTPTLLNQQTLSVMAPANGNECPPGPYMLFVLGQNDVPSIAKIISVKPVPTSTLTVTSNPSSGVSITVSPNDISGQGNGVTPFTRTYNRNTSVTLTAPPTAGGNVFSAWQRDGVNHSTSSNVTVAMDANHTMTAIYVPPPTSMLTVTSSLGSGISITVTPNDNNGQGSGTTPLTRTYNRNTSVTLAAPLTVGVNNFSVWQRDGVNYSTSSNVTVAMDANHTMTAVYVASPTVTLTVSNTSSNITVTPDDINGRGSGTAPFTRIYNRNTAVTLTAPVTIGSLYFQYWQRDGILYSANPTVTITMDANYTMSPKYTPQATGKFRGSNQALATTGAVASASSIYSGAFPASGVNNGDRKGINWGNGGGWADGTINSYPDWIEIDFGRTVVFDEIDVYTVQDNFLNPIEPTPNTTFSLYGITNYDVQYWSGTSWLTIRSVTGNNLVGRTFIFGSLVTTKIRILIHNALNSYSRVTEIEVYRYGVSVVDP